MRLTRNKTIALSLVWFFRKIWTRKKNPTFSSCPFFVERAKEKPRCVEKWSQKPAGWNVCLDNLDTSWVNFLNQNYVRISQDKNLKRSPRKWTSYDTGEIHFIICSRDQCTLRSQLNMRSKDSCLPNKYLPLPLYSYVLIVAKQKKTNSCFWNERNLFKSRITLWRKKPSLAGRLVSTTSKETRIANLSRYFIFENQSWYV